MPDIECKRCFTLMDNEVYLPRMLSCGHTYCSNCLQNILESASPSPSCSRCRKLISSKNVEDYPVNYALLEMICSSTKREQNKAQLLKIKSELEEFKPVLHSMKITMDSAEEQLKDLIESNDGSLDEEEKFAKIKELKETVNEIALQINASNSAIISDVSLWCKDYNILQLIAEIQMGIQVKVQKFAAVLRIDGVKKFAKISISVDYFFIHAFDTYEDDCDFITVCFQDLLNGLLNSDRAIHGFLEMTYRSGFYQQKAIVSVTDTTSFLGPQFLKLCTGEVGVSLKGLKYSQKYGEKICDFSWPIENRSVINIDHIIQLRNSGGQDSDKLCSYSKLISRKTNNVTSVTNNCYLTCDENSSIGIHGFSGIKNTLDFPNVIGPLVDFKGNFAETFRDATLCKVVDCGIAFSL